MSERPLIGVIGDALVDWMLVRGADSVADDVRLERAIKAGAVAHVSSRIAGVTLAGELAAALLRDVYELAGEVVVAHPLPAEALVDPGCAAIARTFSEWALVPRVAGSPERAWRAVTYFGEQRAERAPDVADGAALTARSLIVLDMGQGSGDVPLAPPGGARSVPESVVLVATS